MFPFIRVFPVILCIVLATARHPRRRHSFVNGTNFNHDDLSELQKRDGTKYVFIHHIVGNTHPYTQADWANDIKMIADTGIDAMALNIGPDPWQQKQLGFAYDAAKALNTDLKLFISFDLTEMPCSVSQIVSIVNRFASHRNQFQVDTKPMISSFSGSCLGNWGWADVKKQTNGYLMPFIPDQEGHFDEWRSLDSWLGWGCAWPQGKHDKNTDDDNYYINQLGSRYATTVSAWFFTHYDYKNRLLRSDNWLVNNRWEQLIAMRSRLHFVEIVSFNDFGESTYLGPIRDEQPAGTTWTDGFPHTAWLRMFRFYITAFKTGSYPPITKDVIYYWARPHAASATATSDNIGRPDGSTWTEDYLWAAVFATSSSTVHLTSGSHTESFPVHSGVTKLKIPLSPGSITVKMDKQGSTVINKTPFDFKFDPKPSKYNFNAYVGSAETR